ncbi:MAG TPA: SNF2-related protein [Acidobacteriota bacterium]|nr:SNF2-related protein [Acidobacteriota bacterium]
MSLLGKLAQLFSRNAQNRGADLYYSDSVVLTSIGAESLSADVFDRGRFEVELAREDQVITYSCSCPFYEDQLEPCKHVWATILEAEHEGHLQKWDRKGMIEFYPDDSLEELRDFWKSTGTHEAIADFDGGADFAEEGLEEIEAPDESRDRGTGGLRPGHLSVDSRLLPAGRAVGRRPHPVAAWRQHLRQVRRAMEARPAQFPEGSPSQKEVLYVIDVETSLVTGEIALEIHVRERKKSGEWGKPKPQGINLQAIPGVPDPLDREIHSHLLGIPRAARPQTSYDSAIRFQIPGAVAPILLPIICRTGRCRLAPRAGPRDYIPLRWDDGSPWEFWMEVLADPDGGVYRIGGSLRRGGERLDLSELEVLFEHGIFITRGFIGRFEHSNSFPWISLLRREHPSIPASQKDAWLRELLTLPYLPHLDLPKEMGFETISLKPQPALRVRSNPDPLGPMYFAADLLFNYEGRLVPCEAPGAAISDPARKSRILRDLPTERTSQRRLFEAGFRQRKSLGGRPHWEIAPPLLPEAARILLAEGWQVEAEGKAFRKPGNLKIEVRTGIDWFELHGDIDFGEVRAGLPELLAAVRRGEKMVRLGDGSFGMLPEEWLARFGRLAGLGRNEDDHLRFKRCQVGLLDALLASQPEAECDALFTRAREELRRFERIEPIDPPPGFQGQLRNYQRDGLGWFHFLRQFDFGGCLADDMGLGKTIQVLALLEDRRQLREEEPAAARSKPSLVVVPKSLVFNWKAEAERFTPKLKILDHTGANRIRSHEHFEDYDVICTTYGTLRRDAIHFKDALFDYVILDEAQAIKNAGTESAKAARLLRGNYRLALSGTPIENHLGELWSLFEFLNPGMLGSASVFRLSERELAQPDPQARELLASALRPFILRRTKEQVASDLPPKTEQTLYCVLEGAQRRLYDELRDHYRNSLLGLIEREGLAKSKIQVLEALLRLRQAACHPGLIDGGRVDEHSAKLEMLLPQLEEVLEEGHKVLVFSQFTSLLAIVRARLDSAGTTYEYLDGQTRDRAQPVQRFQTDPDCRLFLVSLKAGGLGLNLTAAEYVYLLDPWWNPAVEAQAIDRTHRIGQTRRVFAYRIIAKDTVEEKVLELQKTKRDLADAIISADNSLIRDLRREDLELLLS